MHIRLPSGFFLHLKTKYQLNAPVLRPIIKPEVENLALAWMTCIFFPELSTKEKNVLGKPVNPFYSILLG